MAHRGRLVLLVPLLAVAARGQEVKLEFPGSILLGQTGRAVGGGSDVDGDGTPDVMVATPTNGRVDILSGVDFSIVRTLLSPLPNGSQFFGQAVDGTGDVDGDGFGDVVISAPVAGIGGTSATVYSGATGLPLHVFTGHLAMGGYGRAVSGAGDVDGDGHADVLVGAFSEFGLDKGEVELRSGKTGAVLYHWEGLSAGETLGTAVSEAGDVDGDGFLDLAAGGAGSSGTTTTRHAGVAEVYSGQTGARIHRWFGSVPDERFGRAVGGGGDLDADGRDDVAVGAAGTSPDRGRVVCHSGATGGVLFERQGEPASQEFGFSVAIVGDADGDGRADVAVGDPQALAAPGLTLVSGAGDAVLARVYPLSLSSRCGASVAAVGDLDGDGLAELVFGEPQATAGSVPLAGRAAVLGLCARSLPYGAPCSAQPVLPTLLVSGCPGPGGSGALEIRDAAAGATAFLLFGTGKGSTAIGNCELLLAGLSPVVVALPLSGGSPGTGQVSVPVTLPAVVPPTTLTLQAVIQSTTLGTSTTNGLEVTLP